MAEVYPEHVKKMSTVPFGVNPQKRILGQDKSSNKNILFAGALNERKGVDVLVRAFIAEGNLESKLYLCGRRFRSTKLVKHTQIIETGFVDIKEYFDKCSIFILPTFMEGSAKVIYEAMAAGLAVITTTAAGSIITDGYDGIIVPAGDEIALQIAIHKLLTEQNLRQALARHAIKTVENYTWEHYISSIYLKYEEIAQ